MLPLAQGRLLAAQPLLSLHRQLDKGWQLLGTAPGEVTDPAQLHAMAGWMDVPALGPVADVLRGTGAWSLDQAEPRRFDAQDWWYRLRFDVDGDHAALQAAACLGLDGLATVAEVWLNGERVLESSNMFRQHRLDVAGRLQPQGNELLLVCRSLDQALTRRRPRPRWRAPMIEHQQLRWFRTTVLGRTPGWSPPAAVVGPWRPIWLASPGRIGVEGLSLHARLDGDVGEVSMRCRIPSVSAVEQVTHLELVLVRDGVRHAQALEVADPRDATPWQGKLTVPQVARWWPHTHGEPALYEAWLEVRIANDTLQVPLGHIGFRQIELDRREDGFALKINGVPVFCRGACWTPLDPVTLDASSAQAYAQAIALVREAGMNMLRVGGTMAYEADAFYDECDRQGVLVWQEFMFANMDYPEDDAFVADVREEARQQLARWQGRPSLTVLCGNSEVEQQAAMFGATRDRWSPALFHTTLAAEAAAHGPDVPYWPSSAHGGSFPHQGDVGTTSYYGVGAYLRGLDDARRASVRFATECLAFSNVPEAATLARMPGGLGLRMHHPGWKTRAPRDLGAGWDFEDVRDHYVTQLFKVDTTRLRYSDHERYLLLGKVAVGEVMAATFDEWRRAASPCQGALIWFLRDLWPGAGWGVIDSLGQGKAPYHYLKRALQPVSVSMTDEGGNGLFVHLHNERDRPLRARLEVSAWRHGDTRVAQAEQPVELPARGTRSQPLLALFDWFADWSYAYRFGPVSAQVLCASLRHADSGDVLAQAFAFPGGHDLPVSGDLGLQATARALGEGLFELTVKTERFAQAVHFDVEGLSPDEAYFHLMPGQARRVLFRPMGTAAPDALTGCVRALNSDAVVNIRSAPAESGAAASP